jgi:hypothetical protein
VACGLHFRDDLPFDLWITLGRKILGISKASPWCIGDWLVYGQRSYGDRYKAALEATDFDYQTLRNYSWVSRRFAMSRRRDTLSFQHHAEVAALTEPEQDLWLDRAEKQSFKRNELRRHMASRRREAQEPVDSIVTVRLRVDPQREERWREAARASMQDLDAWIAAAADGAAETALRPAAI